MLFTPPAPPPTSTLSLHDALPISERVRHRRAVPWIATEARFEALAAAAGHDDWRRWPDDAPWDTDAAWAFEVAQLDRKSTRLNSSHLVISYAVFCLKKQKPNMNT